MAQKKDFDWRRDPTETLELRVAGERIQKARIGHEWSQSELAERLSEASGRPVKQRAISKWENGGGRPSMVYVSALEDVLGLRDGSLWIMYYPDIDWSRRREIVEGIASSDPDDDAPVAAAHLGLDDLTEDEIQQVVEYAEFLRSRREAE